MRPIRVALFHRDDPHRGPPRVDGFFQYPVPEFEWAHFPVNKMFTVDLHEQPFRSYDVAWLDDGKYKDDSRFLPDPPRGTYRCPQVAMYALYPTLSNQHFRRRLNRARALADLVLVDHDDLERWAGTPERPLEVRRCAYCVDETRYRDRGLVRDVDVGFYYVTAFSRERPALDRWLQMHCRERGWTFLSTHGEPVGHDEYALLLSRTKVVIHLNRTPATRPPRIFDAAASGACLVSNFVPRVSGERWVNGENYLGFLDPWSRSYAPFEPDEVPDYSGESFVELQTALNDALGSGERWTEIAANAKERVLACHTWRVRARELRGILLDAFPRLRDRG